MNRRSLLRTFALLAVLVPGYADAFGSDASDAADRRARACLGEAWERAKRRGKPVLVILAPSDERQRRGASELWGDLFLSGSTDLLAELGMAELVAVELPVLARAFPKVASEVPAGSQAVLIETDGAPAVWITAHTYLQKELADSLHRALAADDAAIERRSRRGVARVVHAPNGELRGGPGPERSPSDRELELLPAFYLLSARREPWLRGVPVDRLARRVRSPNAPAGMRWAPVDGGGPCGVGPCGMGVTPKTSRLFLEFFVAGG